MGATLYSYNLLYVTTCIPVSLPHLKLISSITLTVVDSTEVLLLQTRVLLYRVANRITMRALIISNG